MLFYRVNAHIEFCGNLFVFHSIEILQFYDFIGRWFQTGE